MHLFYNPLFSTNQSYLPEEESKHCIKVLRLSTGDEVYITDGKGTLFKTQIATPDSKKCRLQVIETQTEVGKRPYFIHIAIAPTKNADRTEWMVEKCVELGVDKISFLSCERSERKFFKTDRVEKIAIGAMKQSLKTYLPTINDIVPFSTFVKEKREGQQFVAHLEEGKRELLQHAVNKNQNYCVLIGPEGDFSPNEIRLALENGFLPVSLGESRLRTETAGVVACHTLHICNNL